MKNRTLELLAKHFAATKTTELRAIAVTMSIENLAERFAKLAEENGLRKSLSADEIALNFVIGESELTDCVTRAADAVEPLIPGMIDKIDGALQAKLAAA